MPHWLTRGIVYECFPRAFSPAGDLVGVEAGLEGIADLGVTTLWLMPIHPIGQAARKGTLGSPYAVRDYRVVAPELGGERDLTRLVDAAHALGMRVILDWVANHCARDSVLMPWEEWFHRDEAGEVLPGAPDWTDTAWLDHGVPALRRNLIDAMAHWVGGCGVDGFRCDVAGRVPVASWLEAREALEPLRPDLGMLAEAFRPDLMERAFELTYDMPWYWEVDRVLRRWAALEAIRRAHRKFRARFPARAQPMRFSDNHDRERAVTRYGEGWVAAAVHCLTSEGVPLVYNGQEIGDNGPTAGEALFERHPIGWGRERPGARALFRELIHLRRATPALELGSTHFLPSAPRGILPFLRILGDRAVFVAVNLSGSPAELVLEHPALGAGHSLLFERGLDPSGLFRAGCWTLRLAPWGALVAEAQPWTEDANDAREAPR
ncbi:MAG: alpha-amylase family glycosyl hydrolase [Pseudomonadota bacterium]